MHPFKEMKSERGLLGVSPFLNHFGFFLFLARVANAPAMMTIRMTTSAPVVFMVFLLVVGEFYGVQRRLLLDILLAAEALFDPWGWCREVGNYFAKAFSVFG